MSTAKILLNGLERKYKVYSLLSPLVMVGEVVMETAIPLLMSRIIDEGIAHSNLSYVVQVGLLMIGMSIISLACGAMGGRFSAVAALGFSRNVRRRLFAKVQDFSFGNIDHFSTSSLVTRLTTDVTNVQNTYQMLIRMCARAPFMLVSGTIMACIINVKLSTVFFVSIPLLAVVLTLIAFVAYPRFQLMLSKYDNLNSTVQENLTAIRVVKSFVRGQFEQKKFEAAADAVRKTQVRAEKVVIFTMPLMQMVVYACIIAALWFGGKMIVVGDLMTGQLISFISYVTQVLMSLMMLSMVFITMVLSRASISRIVEVLSEKAEIVPPAQNALTCVADGSIDFDHVSFSYHKDPQNCVLSDVNIHIPSGAFVGIIGGTGSSKSTLVSLLPRLYDVLSGSVRVAGHDVRDYDLVTLRDSVAMVLQKNVLFSGTIRENLRWGNENATEEQMIAACKAADAYEFIQSFPKGFDTDLGQGGVNVSGGQKQRLCIARALLKNPRILILDDSTSAVDTATDARIRSALRSCAPKATKIVIAQRIASVQDADIIYVLDNGVVNGSGTHEQLMQSNEIYREVFESQQAAN